MILMLHINKHPATGTAIISVEWLGQRRVGLGTKPKPYTELEADLFKDFQSFITNVINPKLERGKRKP